MLIKITFSPMYGGDYSAKTVWFNAPGLKGERTPFVDSEDKATEFDSMTEAAKFVEVIEELMTADEMLIESIEIYRIGN